MASGEIRVGDIGTAFRLTVRDEGNRVVDIGGATTRQLLFRPPSSATVRKAAVPVTDGSDGMMQYVTVSGDLSEPGTWRMQGYIEISGDAWHTDIVKFRVYENL